MQVLCQASFTDESNQFYFHSVVMRMLSYGRPQNGIETDKLQIHLKPTG